MTVLLATSAGWPAGEPGAAALEKALVARGVDSRWEVWDDPSVDWAAADLVAVRSTWDYAARAADFLAWARSLDQDRLLNGADVFAWNHDKAYLVDALDGVPVVPTRTVDSTQEIAAAIADFGTTVVKPRVGAGGNGVIVVTDPRDPRLGRPHSSHPEFPPVDGPWIAQPLVESIRTRGETSVFVLGGRPVAQVDKVPSAGDFRVHEHFGGSSRPVGLSGEAATVAVQACRSVAERFGRDPDYARVDLVMWDGHLHVSELELIEPGLYLDVLPSNAEPFADLVRARCR